MSANRGPTDRPAGFVIKASPHGYFVRSRSQAGVWWFTQADSCSCPATVDNCWHIMQVFRFEREMAKPRPSAPPATSMMVD